jgi:hypothetical protein
MRKLYFLLVVMIMTNTVRCISLSLGNYYQLIQGQANGFDGSMMNGLQGLTYWQEYFNYPKGSILGLFK